MNLLIIFDNDSRQILVYRVNMVQCIVVANLHEETIDVSDILIWSSNRTSYVLLR